MTENQFIKISNKISEIESDIFSEMLSTKQFKACVLLPKKMFDLQTGQVKQITIKHGSFRVYINGVIKNNRFCLKASIDQIKDGSIEINTTINNILAGVVCSVDKANYFLNQIKLGLN